MWLKKWRHLLPDEFDFSTTEANLPESYEEATERLRAELKQLQEDSKELDRLEELASDVLPFIIVVSLIVLGALV